MLRTALTKEFYRAEVTPAGTVTAKAIFPPHRYLQLPNGMDSFGWRVSVENAGTLLRTLRGSKPRKAVARHVDIPDDRLSRIERGQPVRYSTAFDIASALGSMLLVLFTESKPCGDGAGSNVGLLAGPVGYLNGLRHLFREQREMRELTPEQLAASIPPNAAWRPSGNAITEFERRDREPGNMDHAAAIFSVLGFSVDLVLVTSSNTPPMVDRVVTGRSAEVGEMAQVVGNSYGSL